MEGLWCLGREESCVYLVEGEHESMLINGGMAYLAPVLQSQFDIFGIDKDRITKILLPHSHFDHVGVVPFLKSRLRRDIRVYASARALRILRMPRVLSAINHAGRKTAERMGFSGIYDQYPLDWSVDISGVSVSEGERLPIGPFEGIVLETPGHSACSISFYMPEIEVMFSSDSGGIPYGDTILSAGYSNFTEYLNSLEKLQKFDIACLCADHYGYVKGSEAALYMKRSLDAAFRRRRDLMLAYRAAGNVEGATAELVKTFYADRPDYFLPPEILTPVYRQMVRHVVRSASKG